MSCRSVAESGAVHLFGQLADLDGRAAASLSRSSRWSVSSQISRSTPLNRAAGASDARNAARAMASASMGSDLSQARAEFRACAISFGGTHDALTEPGVLRIPVFDEPVPDHGKDALTVIGHVRDARSCCGGGPRLPQSFGIWLRPNLFQQRQGILPVVPTLQVGSLRVRVRRRRRCECACARRSSHPCCVSALFACG